VPSPTTANKHLKFDRPIDLSTVQLPSKTSRFLVEFRGLSRVRSTESSGFMERAMGIAPTSEVGKLAIQTRFIGLGFDCCRHLC